MDAPDSWQEILIRPAAAMIGAALLGLDRELRNKPAGLRTHMMVALGATAFTITTLLMFQQMQEQGGRWTGVDPIRVISGIVGGIGFLGAGAIIQSRRSVEGVTTAATIWAVGAVGVACGAGYYRVATVVVGYALIVLVVVGWIEHRLPRRSRQETHADEASDEPERPRAVRRGPLGE
jgi:putative Mg2+ transporter-C (MgtC) family protein